MLVKSGNNDMFHVSVFGLEAWDHHNKKNWKFLVHFEKNVLEKAWLMKELNSSSLGSAAMS